MKKITLWLFALLSCWQISAQVNAYSFAEGVSAYAALGGTNITATGDDSSQDGLPIGFIFNFGGANFTTFSATTNGWIRLGSPMPASTFSNTAANFIATTHRPLIAPMWDDNNRGTGAISYSVSGVSPSQVLTVDYNGVNIGGSGATSATNLANYQIKLYETTNVIEIHYGALATAGTLSATIGLSDVSGFHSVTPGAPGTSSVTTGNHAISAVTNVANKLYTFTPPACGAPGALTATNVTNNSATIGWNSASPLPAAGFEYVFSTTNATPTGAGIPTNNLSEVISPLTAQTTYYVYVRSNCGGTFSAWNSFSFTTACDPITALPFSENLTTYLPNTCWYESDNGNLTLGPLTRTDGSWLVDGLGNVGTTGAARITLDGAVDNDWLILPQFTIPATGYELKFNAAATQNGSTAVPTTAWEADDFVEVLVSTNGSTNWVPVYTFNNGNAPLNTGSEIVIDLSSYASQTIRFAYRGVEGAANGAASIDFSIDNIEVRLTPTCPDQTGLGFANVTATGVETSWDPTAGIGYQYDITTSATPPASGTATTATFYIPSAALTPQTVYYIHVRTECAGGLFGNWATVSFTTLCDALTTLPHAESFDATTNPNCWTTSLVTGTTNWAPDTDNDGVPAARTGARFAGKSWVGNDDALLISPAYNLAAYPTNQTRLNVWIYRSANGLATDKITFHANTLPNLTGATQLLDVPLPITAAPTVASAGWYNYIVDVPLSYNGGGNFYIIAQGRTSSSFSSYGIGFDDYTFELSPTCPDQTGLGFSNVTATGVETSWDVTAGVGYEYAITTSATPPASGTPTTATFYIPSAALTPQTVYYLHVRTECAGSTYGNWATISFTTSCTSVTDFIENFDSVTTPAFPSCWEKVGATGTANTQSTNGNSAPNAMYIASFSAASLAVVKMQPVSNLGYGTHRIKFDMRGNFTAGDAIEFGYLTNPADASTFVSLTSFTAASLTYQTYEFAPPAGTYSDYVAFRHSGVSYSILIDNVIWEAIPACPNPTGLLTSNLTTTSADVSWPAVASATGGYEYVFDTTAGDPVVAGTVIAGLTYAATPLTLSTTYYFHIRSICAGSTYSTWTNYSFTTPANDPPSNDNCSGAILLTAGGVFADFAVSATNLGATGSTETAPGCAAYLGGDVWYSVEVPASGSLTFENNTNSTMTDSAAAIYSGTCGALVLVDCDDSSSSAGNDHPLMTVTGRTPGEILYYRVWEYNNDVFDTVLVSAYDASLSASSFDKSTFVAYPNPVKDVLNLSYKTAISNVKVINLLGQEVLNVKANTNDVQVNMSALNAGAYIVNITVEDTVHTIKVIKE